MTRSIPLELRIIEKIELGDSGCWLWTDSLTPDGYGKITVAGKSKAAHREAYKLFVGPIPSGLQIDHLCRRRNCINPAHLEAVSSKENSLRGIGFVARNAAKTHCPQGHSYDENGVWVITGHATNGRENRGRRCRICIRNKDRAYYLATKTLPKAGAA